MGLRQLAAVMKRSALFIGNDGGPMHMAAMAGVPVAVLFGPTHPERVGPYGVAHVIIKSGNLNCLGCRKRTCKHMKCMANIGTDIVYDAVVRLLR